MFPYCLYLKYLDLNLMFPTGTRGEYQIYYDIFLDPELVTLGAFNGHKHNNHKDVNRFKTSEFIEHSVVSFISEAAKRSRTTSGLECLDWHSIGSALTKWISQLPKLKSLAIPSRNPTDLTDLARAISNHCPEFQEFTLIANQLSETTEIDQMIAQFLRTLKKNTLRKFLAISLDTFFTDNCTGTETLLALNHHAESITSLKFSNLHPNILEVLPLLRVNKNLTSLQLTPAYCRELGKDHRFLLQSLIDWICSCHGLRELSVGYSFDGIAILTRVCNSDKIRLRKLEVLNLKFTESDEFFNALRLHTSLEYLHLEGDVKSCCKVAKTNILRTIPSLPNLKFLDLCTNHGSCLGSGGYPLSMITKLTEYLPQLEEFTFCCKDPTDSLWPSMLTLRHLRSLNIYCSPLKFTGEKIIAFIDALQDSHKGFELVIATRSHKRDFDSESISSIRNRIHNKVSGDFQIRSP
ncbi:hypothetical protein K3495_g1217 [Podosphaera aphanis]|nr:hypothetical protein K3495_g1217 [Podosphaera aphanis]